MRFFAALHLLEGDLSRVSADRAAQARAKLLRKRERLALHCAMRATVEVPASEGRRWAFERWRHYRARRLLERVHRAAPASVDQLLAVVEDEDLDIRRRVAAARWLMAALRG